MKNYFKKLREKSFKSTISTEAILLIIVTALVIFKFKSESKTSINNLPKGDFGPSPYSKHLDSSKPNE